MPSKDQFPKYMKKECTFKQGDFVWVRNYRGAVRWIAGEINDVLGPSNYKITSKIDIWKRHIDQIRHRHEWDILEQMSHELLNDNNSQVASHQHFSHYTSFPQSATSSPVSNVTLPGRAQTSYDVTSSTPIEPNSLPNMTHTLGHDLLTTRGDQAYQTNSGRVVIKPKKMADTYKGGENPEVEVFINKCAISYCWLHCNSIYNIITTLST